jgi:Flp pilus assembly protein TadG
MLNRPTLRHSVSRVTRGCRRLGRALWRAEDDSGQSLVMVVVFLPALLAMVGLVLSIGRVYVVRTQMTNAVVLAAEGGAQAAAAAATDGASGAGVTNLTTSTDLATGTAALLATFNANVQSAHLEHSYTNLDYGYAPAGSANPCGGGEVSQPSFFIHARGVVSGLGIAASVFGVSSAHFPLCAVSAIEQNAQLGATG